MHKMKRHIAALFDLDGVIIDTEPQYDIFWRRMGQKYGLGIENFEQLIKGTTLTDIIALYFSHLSPETQQEIVAANKTFDLQMDILPVPGALEFLASLKAAGIKLALVTSSDDKKLDYVFRILPVRTCFDVLVSAGRVTEGKPNPACYLLAAHDLDIHPENCYVFEDSFNGIAAGNAAGMKVIGLSTTNPAESIRDKTLKTIPDFRGFTLKDME
jgi:HAD superfamily hydrolase (TIGR01509 family)